MGYTAKDYEREAAAAWTFAKAVLETYPHAHHQEGRWIVDEIVPSECTIVELEPVEELHSKVLHVFYGKPFAGGIVYAAGVGHWSQPRMLTAFCDAKSDGRDGALARALIAWSADP